jgi:pimeloyl-[acyl-carrier protein] methyl ester esterase
MRRIVLLPGLDGTGALFERFVRAAPPGLQLDVVSLPPERLGYEALVERLAPRLQLTPTTILIAESFSGPLAILLAQSQRIAALVLCNTFVKPPGPRALAALPLASLFHLPLPAILVRQYLVGPEAPDILVARVRSTIAAVPPAVLAARLSSVLSVDVAGDFARCTAPLLYLRGTRDRVVSEPSVQALVSAASVPVSVVRIPGPHLLLQTAPEAAWRAIEEYAFKPQAA